MPPATSLTTWLWMLSRLPWGRFSTISRSNTSVMFDLVVCTSGAFSTTAISSVLVCTFITTLISLAALMPTLTPFRITVSSLRRRGAHLEVARLQGGQPERALVAGIGDLGTADLGG